MQQLYPHQVQQHLDRWVKDFLSVPQSEFSNLPPCPYCRQAWLERRVMIHVCQTFLETCQTLLAMSQNWNEHWEVAILATHPTLVDGHELVAQVQKLNPVLSKHDLIALVDHPGNPETTLSHINTSNGEYLLVLVQRLRSLQTASAHLQKMGYYQHWSAQDLDNIVHWRSSLEAEAD
ncbi:hypothetical protein C7B76_20915 [filamentous cyanobacterium CCP2]|nr:hypothetical protein C7B76_20915 [filamentous cyanobacterium CCP2]